MPFTNISGMKLLYRSAMLFSWGTTGYAAVTILPEGMETWLKYAFAFGISTLIQLIIGFAWPECARMFRRYCFFTALILGSFALGGTITSGLLASSTNTSVWRYVQVQNQADTKTVIKALEPVEEAARQAETVAYLLSDYAAFAQSESLLEARSGTSCDGLNTDNTCGPLCRLRNSQSTDASLRKENTQTLLAKVDSLRASAGGEVTQEVVNRLFLEANALSRDELFGETARWAARERNAFDGGGHQFEGGTLQCRDAEAVRRLDAITAALPQGGNGDVIPPTVITPGISYVASENAAALQHVWESVIVEGRDPLVILSEEPASIYAPFWLFSLLIEMICVVLGIRLSLDNLPPLGTPRDDRPSSKEQLNRAEAVGEVLENLVIRNGRHTYFLVPVGGKKNRLNRNARTISRLPRKLRLRRFTVRSAIPLDELIPADALRIRAATGADFVEVFKVGSLRKLERRLAEVVGIDDTPPANVVSMHARP